MKKVRNSFGFTLIELLVVISIIALLATVLLANFNASRSRARDAQRKSNLRSIQTALRLYYNDFNKFPLSTAGGAIRGCGSLGESTCDWNAAFEANSETYMSVLPGDPSSPSRDYIYEQIDRDAYTLKACLENASDDKCHPVETCSAGLSGCLYLVQP